VPSVGMKKENFLCRAKENLLIINNFASQLRVRN